MKIMIRKLMKKRSWIQLSVWLLIFISCLNCSNKHFLKLIIHALPESNDGYSVVVRIHQLRSNTRFNNLTIDKYIQNPEQALGEDQIGKFEEQTLYHASVIELKHFQLDKETKFVAIIANYYHTQENSQWRLLLPIEQWRGKQVFVESHKHSLRIVNRHLSK